MTFEQAHRAIKRAQLGALKAAIPSELSASATNRFGWTLLMLAAIEGNTKVGEFLIAEGAKVAALNNGGENALSLAAHGGHLPFLRLMIEHGASSDVLPHGHSLETWIRTTSGLSKAKIEAIFELV